MSKNIQTCEGSDLTPPTSHQLSRRERQIMDIVYPLGQATVAQVREEMPDAPSYSAVRAMLSILEGKGHLRHEIENTRYIYVPTKPHAQAAQSMLHQIVQTFFGGSIERTVATLLSTSDSKLSPDELERLAELIEQAKQEGR